MRCKGTTLKGKRCKLISCSDFCYHHSPKPECSICYETVVSEVKLDCNHSFCKNCIYRWLIETQNCPYCRSEVNDCVEEVVKYGISNKLLACVTDNIVDISSLSQDELDSIDFFGIKTHFFMLDDEWNNKKTLLLLLNPGVYHKLINLGHVSRKSYIKTNPENFEKINNSIFWLFD
jgi:hypothetical protein